MNTTITRWTAVVLGLFLAAATRGEPAGAKADAAPTAATMLNFSLMDGAVITGGLGLKEIAIETEFGPLKVPVARVQSLTPGLDSHTDFQKKIADLVEKLGAPEAPARDAAQKELVRIGPSLRAELTRFQNAADPERRLRITAILEEFNEAVDPDAETPAAADAIIHMDSIETPDFTIVGRIVPKIFEVSSPYGPLTVKLADIRRAAKPSLKEKEDVVKSVTVDGTNMVQVRFKETGIRLERGDAVSIKAEGSLILTPWGNEAQSTPDGAPNYGWYINGQIPMGTLVGKVGKSGSIFKVGSSYNFTAQQTGDLQLAIAMQQGYANNMFPGKYTIKVRIKPKPATADR